MEENEIKKIIKDVSISMENKGYNPMFKYNSVEEFKDALRNNKHIPNRSDIILEAYIDDNLVDRGNTFEETLKKLDLVLGLFD